MFRRCKIFNCTDTLTAAHYQDFLLHIRTTQHKNKSPEPQKLEFIRRHEKSSLNTLMTHAMYIFYCSSTNQYQPCKRIYGYSSWEYKLFNQLSILKGTNSHWNFRPFIFRPFKGNFWLLKDNHSLAPEGERELERIVTQWFIFISYQNEAKYILLLLQASARPSRKKGREGKSFQTCNYLSSGFPVWFSFSSPESNARVYIQSADPGFCLCASLKRANNIILGNTTKGLKIKVLYYIVFINIDMMS